MGDGAEVMCRECSRDWWQRWTGRICTNMWRRPTDVQFYQFCVFITISILALIVI